jgi:hypothetical protein
VDYLRSYLNEDASLFDNRGGRKLVSPLSFSNDLCRIMEILRARSGEGASLSLCGIVEFLRGRSGEGASLFNNLRGIVECLRGRLGDSVPLFRLRGRERQCFLLFSLTRTTIIMTSL